MSVGKISELVDESALAQLDQLYQKLGIATQAMKEGVVTSAEYTNAIGKVNSITEFNAVTQQASNSLVDLKQKQQQVTDLQKQATAATNQLVEATKANLVAGADASVVLQKLGGSYDAAIKQLIEQKIELAQVTEQLKVHQKALGDSVNSQVKGIETTAKLTQQQLLLKEAIAQNTLTIKQQTKEQLSAETSNNMYMAQLNQMIKLQNSMSQSEKETTVYGKELQAQIEATRAAMVANNEAQGKFNDNVGNYPGKAEGAIASTEKMGKSFDITGRLAKSMTNRLFRMAASFLLITVAFGAIQWLYEWISGLDMFTGRLDKVMQGWKAWSEVMAEGNKNAGEGLAKLEVLNKAAQDNNLTENERIKAAEKMKELWPDKLKNLSDEAIMNGEVADSIKQVTAEIEKQALAEAGLKKITDIESKILDEKTLQEKLNNVRQHRLARVKEDIVSGSAGGGSMTGGGAATLDVNTVSNQKRQINDDINAQIKDSNAVIDVLNSTKKIIEDNIGIGDLAKAAEGKPKKVRAKKDNSWELYVANLKARLEKQKAIAKEGLDNDQLTYNQRLNHLATYIAASNKLIELERRAKNHKPGITAIERDTNQIESETQRLGVTAFNKSEQDRLNKERLDALKKQLEGMLKLEKDAATNTINILQEQTENQLTILDVEKNKEESLLAEKRKNGIVDEKEYRKELKRIADEYNIDRLGAIAFQEQSKLEILQAKENNDVSFAKGIGFASGEAPSKTDAKVADIKANSGVSQQKRVVTKAGIALNEAINNKTQDDGKPNDPLKEKLDEILPYVDQAVNALNVVDQLVNNIAQAKIEALQKESELIAQNGEAEKERVSNSILSSKEKAREQKVIDAQVHQQQLAIAAEERKIKQDAAKFDKAANIARAIESTASGVAAALPNIALAAIVGAIGLAQVAVITAQPIPAFKGGTKSSPEGYAKISEAGPELLIDPTGKLSLTPDRESIMYLQKGTQVIPNHELIKMVGKPEMVNIISNETNGHRKTEKLLEKIYEQQKNAKRPVVNVNIDPWGEYSKRRNH